MFVNKYFAIMSELNKIERLLELAKTQDWLQFPGGSGGEFFALHISKYSPIYENLTHLTTVNSENRTVIELPKFFKLMASVPAMTGNLDDLYTGIIHDAKILRLELDKELDIAEKFIKDKKYLLRVHYSVNEYFNKQNSFAIIPDNELWLEYSSLMRVIKACSYKLDYNLASMYFDEYTSKSGRDRQKYDDALKWMLNNNQTEIYFGHIYCIEYLDEIGSYKDIFTMSLVDIYNFFLNKIKKVHLPSCPVYHANFIQDSTTMLTDNVNIIEYTKIFNKGYLENMFNINNPEFHQELLSWHTTNISLIKSYGFDTDKFII